MKLVLSLLLILSAILGADEPKVILHLLDHTGKEATDKKFWIDWCEEWRAVEKTKRIEGEDAKKVIAQLKTSLKGAESMNLCGHTPIYGIIARNEKGETIKTSLCFSCCTWVQPAIGRGKRLVIKGEHGIENPLCLVLRKHIELPESILEANKRKGPKSE